MPLTEKGEKIMTAMQKEHGAEEGKRIFYASKEKGTITGVDSMNDDCSSKVDAILAKCDAYNKLDAVLSKCDGPLGPSRGGVSPLMERILQENNDRLVNTKPMQQVRSNVQSYLKGLGQK